MIIELLGPSGAGKTTIADALAVRLREEGYAVQTVIWRRNQLLSRSLAKGVSTIQSWFPRAPQTRLASVLMRLLPPRNILWSMRLRSYLSQLWGMSVASTSVTGITLLDQGFVQIICSLVLLSGIADRRRIAEALACVPKPDLVIRVDVPSNVLEVRLLERRKHLGLIQRWLELDLQTRPDQVKTVEVLSELLASKGQHFVTISCTDKSALAAAIEKILAEVRSRAGMARDTVAPPECETDRAASGGLGAIAGRAARSPRDERSYQEGTFARRYLGAYEGPIRPSTLATWIIATRERRCVAQALRECQPAPAMVLDMPCGTGKLAKVLTTMGAQVVGADLSMAMMELAKEPYQAPHFSGFVCGSADRLPFCTAAFDTVVCLRFMHLVPPASRRDIMKELARVASRRLIVSFGVGSPFQLLRLKLRHVIFRSTSTPHPARLEDLRIEIEEAGLQITQQRSILPILSCECLLTLEKTEASPLEKPVHPVEPDRELVL
jgi:SAM-dependent methyltransferase/thymidylate kinase